MSEDLERWRAWIGCHEETEDTIDVGRARAMQATLDDPGAPAPDGRSAALWVADAQGRYASRGSVELA